MLKWLIDSMSCTVVALSLVLALTSTAQAADMQAVELSYQGQSGVWFPSDMAQELQKDIEELQELRLSEKLLTKRLDLKDERILLLQAAVGLGKESEQKLHLQLTQVIDLKVRAEAKANAWWRSPILWTVVGVVTGVVIVVGASKLVEARK